MTTLLWARYVLLAALGTLAMLFLHASGNDHD
jgi:hypothetical protein